MRRFSWCVVACLVVASCGGDDGGEEGYSPELRREFVADCTASGTAEELCSCYYDRLEAEVPFERFQELDEALREAPVELPQDIQDMAVDCALQAEDS